MRGYRGGHDAGLALDAKRSCCGSHDAGLALDASGVFVDVTMRGWRSTRSGAVREVTMLGWRSMRAELSWRSRCGVGARREAELSRKIARATRT